jgi:hypothetical protein
VVAPISGAAKFVIVAFVKSHVLPDVKVIGAAPPILMAVAYLVPIFNAPVASIYDILL